METDEKNEQFFSTMEDSLKSEAKTLLSAETIEKTLQNEKQKWIFARKAKIPAENYIGNNLTRYSKGLVRASQPFPFLYHFLGFMMEFSMCLLLYVIIYGVVNNALKASSAFLNPVEFLYAGSIIFCLLLFINGKQVILNHLLKTYSNKREPDKLSLSDISTFRKKSGQYLFLMSALSLILCCILCLVIKIFDFSGRLRIDLLTAFLIYASFALLSGIHNVIYSSHFLPFFTIGGSFLSNRPKEFTAEALTHYKLLSYEQILSRTGRDMEQFTRDETTAGETMGILRGRLNTYRIYSILGLFIAFILDIVCIRTLLSSISLSLAVFFLCSLIGTVVFLTAFLSAHLTIKTLPKK